MKTKVFCAIVFLISGFISGQTLTETQFSAPIGFGARAFGMGGAFIAIADDATAATWNPGGLGQIEHIEVSAIGSYYDFERYESVTIFNNGQSGTVIRQGDSLSYDFFGISIPIRPFTESDFKIVLQYSYQRSINFNIKSNTNPIQFVFSGVGELGQRFEETGYRYENEEFTGGLDAHSIGLGLKFTQWLNLGLTANIWTNGYDGGKFFESLGKITNLDTGVIHENIVTTTVLDISEFSGTSFNFGALLQLTDNLNIGLVYKSKFTLEVRNPDGALKDKIDYPQSFGLGAALRPVDNLTLATDFTYTYWSKGRVYNENYNRFFPMREIEYQEKQEGIEQPLHLFQQNTSQWRFGAEYVFIAEDLLIPLRAGIYFDSQYFADMLDIQPTYTGFTAGIGVVWKNIVVDLAAVYVSGHYTANVWSTGTTDFSYIKGIASIIYRF
jgi:long-chain fatty acid transport protein